MASTTQQHQRGHEHSSAQTPSSERQPPGGERLSTTPSEYHVLDGMIRPYAWGSPAAIPELLGIDPSDEPAAELWLGAHPEAPARVRGRTENLAELIARDPERVLGTQCVSEFGPRLPFLLKVLAADHPLSLQVHPTAEQARLGFDDEDGRGIPLDAPERCYRDRAHKPELLCALTDFEALCGFRPVAASLRLLDALQVSTLEPYRAMLGGLDGLRMAATALLRLGRQETRELTAEVHAGCARLSESGGEWADVARWGVGIAAAYPGDIGSVLALLLNYLRLRPGQAVYLAAGQIHAYLRGMGVEIMASSDNVLRCGLTPKHVDAAEVLRIASFDAVHAGPLEAAVSADGWPTFPTPARDFRLSVIDLAAPPAQLIAAGPEILLCTGGAITLSIDGHDVTVPRGGAAFLTSSQSAELSGEGTVFRASVGGQ